MAQPVQREPGRSCRIRAQCGWPVPSGRRTRRRVPAGTALHDDPAAPRRADTARVSSRTGPDGLDPVVEVDGVGPPGDDQPARRIGRGPGVLRRVRRRAGAAGSSGRRRAGDRGRPAPRRSLRPGAPPGVTTPPHRSERYAGLQDGDPAEGAPQQREHHPPPVRELVESARVDEAPRRAHRIGPTRAASPARTGRGVSTRATPRVVPGRGRRRYACRQPATLSCGEPSGRDPSARRKVRRCGHAG